MTQQQSIPLHLVCGFLGSGKTTLIKRILASGEKVAFIQNEFSNGMGIELPTMFNKDGEIVPDLWELPSGCLCCTIKDSLATTLEMILDKSTDEPFQRVIVECNGVADPVEIIHKLWTDDELGCNFHLQNSICLIDSAAFVSNLDSFQATMAYAMSRQVAAADVVILNKIDVAHDRCVLSKDIDSHMERLRNTLSEINPTALMIEALPKSDVILTEVYDVNMNDLERLPSLDSALCQRSNWVENRLLTWQHTSNFTVSRFFEWIDKWFWSHEYQKQQRSLYSENQVFDSMSCFKFPSRANDTTALELGIDLLPSLPMMTHCDAESLKSTDGQMQIIRAKGLFRACCDRPGLLNNDYDETSGEGPQWLSFQVVGTDVEVNHEPRMANVATGNKLLLVGRNLPSMEELYEGLL